MERRAVPGELSGRRGVATLVRSLPVAVAFRFILPGLSSKFGGIQQRDRCEDRVHRRDSPVTID